MTASKIDQIQKGTPLDTKNTVWQRQTELNNVWRRLSVSFEQRIRELCAKVVAAPDSEVRSAIAELKKALQEGKSADDISSAKVVKS